MVGCHWLCVREHCCQAHPRFRSCVFICDTQCSSVSVLKKKSFMKTKHFEHNVVLLCCFYWILMQSACDDCFTPQFVCWVTSLDSGMSRTEPRLESSNVDVEHRHGAVLLSHPLPPPRRLVAARKRCVMDSKSDCHLRPHELRFTPSDLRGQLSIGGLRQ